MEVYLINAINNNNFDEICKIFADIELKEYVIFKKDNLHLFKQNKYDNHILNYFKGWYYYGCYYYRKKFLDLKISILLMKKCIKLCYLFNHLSILYYETKKYNKSLYLFKKK